MVPLSTDDGQFGSVEEHYKYRDAVKKAYPYSHFPLFQDENS